MTPSIQRQRNTSHLTPREVEVMLLVAQGHINKTIAGILCLSEKTVRNHVTHILNKLHLNRRSQLVSYAWQVGWVAKEGKDVQSTSMHEGLMWDI